MNAAKAQARRDAVAALTEALNKVRHYLDCHSTQKERLEMIGLEPELHELARRFEYETKDDGGGL
jgi:hypothetical protein